ncbi:MAG: TPM domain-containing protein [Clostridium sp.]|nr:TPM domain-containing protein [Clostridium sp.]
MKKHIIYKIVCSFMCLGIGLCSTGIPVTAHDNTALIRNIEFSSAGTLNNGNILSKTYSISTNMLSIGTSVSNATSASKSISSQRQSERLVDNANLINNDEEEELLNKLNEISERQKCDVVVVTVPSLQNKTATEYADDFFDYNGYGIGENKDGILLLVSSDNHKWAISTHGYGITAFTDAGQKYIMDQVKPSLSDAQYGEAFTVFSEDCDEFLTEAKENKPYDSKHMPKKKVTAAWILSNFIIGAAVAFVIIGIWKRQLKTVESEDDADSYIVDGSFKLTGKNDVYLYSNVVKTEKTKDSDDNGSSTHTSSSGESHGGSSGDF